MYKDIVFETDENIEITDKSILVKHIKEG